MNKTLKKTISREHYMKLLDTVNKNEIWTLSNYYRNWSNNGYYEVKAIRGIQHNIFKFAAGIPLLGEQSKYLEIKRTITNIAASTIYDWEKN